MAGACVRYTGRYKGREVWRAIERMAFGAAPVPSLRSVARQLGISKNTAFGIWHEIASYRRAGQAHPKLKETGE